MHVGEGMWDEVWTECFSQGRCVHIDRVYGLYLVEYLPGIGQQLVQVVYVPSVVHKHT